MSFQKRDYLNALDFELECTKILTRITSADLILNNVKIQECKIELMSLISRSEIKLNGISNHQIVQLYLNRHKRFIGRTLSTLRQDSKNLAVEGNKNDKCKWPLGCYHEGPVNIDHLLPQSSMSPDLSALFDKTLNSLTLCPIHNQVVKRDSIAIGLWIRQLIVFKS